MDVKSKLISLVTEWDRRQSKKKSYNIHALPIMLGAVDELMEEVGKGVSVENAIKKHFIDRLGDFMLREYKKWASL